MAEQNYMTNTPNKPERKSIRTIFTQNSSEKFPPHDIINIRRELKRKEIEIEKREANSVEVSHFEHDSSIEPTTEVRSLFDEMKKRFVLPEKLTQPQSNQAKPPKSLTSNQSHSARNQQSLSPTADLPHKLDRSARTGAIKPLKNIRGSEENLRVSRADLSANHSPRDHSQSNQNNRYMYDTANQTSPLSHQIKVRQSFEAYYTPPTSRSSQIPHTQEEKSTINTSEHILGAPYLSQWNSPLNNSKKEKEKEKEDQSRQSRYDREKIDKIISRIRNQEPSSKMILVISNQEHESLHESKDNATSERKKSPSIFSSFTPNKSRNYYRQEDSLKRIDNIHQNQSNSGSHSSKDLHAFLSKTNLGKMKNFFSSHTKENNSTETKTNSNYDKDSDWIRQRSYNQESKKALESDAVLKNDLSQGRSGLKAKNQNTEVAQGGNELKYNFYRPDHVDLTFAERYQSAKVYKTAAVSERENKHQRSATNYEADLQEEVLQGAYETFRDQSEEKVQSSKVHSSPAEYHALESRHQGVKIQPDSVKDGAQFYLGYNSSPTFASIDEEEYYQLPSKEKENTKTRGVTQPSSGEGLQSQTANKKESLARRLCLDFGETQPEKVETKQQSRIIRAKKSAGKSDISEANITDDQKEGQDDDRRMITGKELREQFDFINEGSIPAKEISNTNTSQKVVKRSLGKAVYQNAQVPLKKESSITSLDQDMRSNSTNNPSAPLRGLKTEISLCRNASRP